MTLYCIADRLLKEIPTMFKSSWLRHLKCAFNSLATPRTQRTPTKRRPHHRSSVEVLEDRLSPSVTAVSVADPSLILSPHPDLGSSVSSRTSLSGDARY